MKCVIGIDQSTQGTKALLIDENARIIAKAYMAHRQIITPEGYICHDPEEIYENVKSVVKDVIRQVTDAEVTAIGISNQRETTVAWDAFSKKPIMDAVVWQCTRAKDVCKQISDSNGEYIRRVTGIPLSPYFPAAKMKWILENSSQTSDLSKGGRLKFGTVDSWLIYKMTGEHLTDTSNASRTQLMNLETLDWDEKALEIFGVERASLAKICPSDGDFGETDLGGIFEHKVPIYAVMGDSHAALFAQRCHSAGELKVTYGTGSSVMMNTGDDIISSNHGLASSVAFSFMGKTSYALEGNVNYSGAVISWLKSDLELIKSADETEALALMANKQDKTYLVPAFSGLGAPYWKNDARAVIVGMTRLTGKAELVRAALDSIALQINDVLVAMSEDSGTKIMTIATDGGPTKNKYLMQFQSDIAMAEIRVSKTEELSGMGAGLMAGIKSGVFDAKIAFKGIEYSRYAPKMSATRRNEIIAGWKEAVEKV